VTATFGSDAPVVAVAAPIAATSGARTLCPFPYLSMFVLSHSLSLSQLTQRRAMCKCARS
jgi:hypothetical protein